MCSHAAGCSTPAHGYLDLRPLADIQRTDEVPRRGAPRRRAPRVDRAAAARVEDSQRHAARVSRLGTGRPRDRPRLRQRPRHRLERRRRARRSPVSTSARSSRAEAVESLRPACSAICAGCRFATARSTRRWSLDVLEHLSPAGPARRARRGQSRSGRRRRAVRLHARAQERLARPAACARVNRLAHACERLGLLDLRQERLRKSDHLNPIADHDELRRVVGDAGFRDRAADVLHADRRRARREHPRAHGRTRAGPTRRATNARRQRQCRDAVRAARTAAQARVRKRGATYQALVALDGGDEARRAAVRTHSIGAVLRPAAEVAGLKCDDAPALRRARSDRAGHARRVRPRAGGR